MIAVNFLLPNGEISAQSRDGYSKVRFLRPRGCVALFTGQRKKKSTLNKVSRG
jgi:hypothetical protein